VDGCEEGRWGSQAAFRPLSCFETALKVYVYDTGNLTKQPLYCSAGQWGTEVVVHKWLEQAACRTMNPEEADFFFVPSYSTCLWVKEGVENDTAAEQKIFGPIMELLASSPWYKRRDGMDHIFLFADGQGPRKWLQYDLVRSSSIFLQVEAKCPTWNDEELRERQVDVKSCFSRWKDIVIPGHTDYARLAYMRLHNRPSDERRLIATFHGRHGRLHQGYRYCTVRNELAALGAQGEPGLDIGGFVGDYLERMGLSHFCIVPAGTSPWTNHLYESFFSGCIPVIMSDEYELPFWEEIDWPSLSIRWPEGVANETLVDFLGSFGQESVREMKARVDATACWFDWYSTDPSCSPLLAITRALERRKERFPRYHGHFWNSPYKESAPPRRTLFHVFPDEGDMFPQIPEIFVAKEDD
jgi:hypothetical protein